MIVKKFQSEKEWIAESVDFMERACEEDHIFRVALSGGSTPIPVYEAFAASNNLPKNLHITFFQVDERCVPPDHPDSNKRLLSEHFIQPFTKRNDGIYYITSGYFFETKIPIKKALKHYEKSIQFELRPLPPPLNVPFHLTILGLGSDGHTASLFPHSPALSDNEHAVAHTITDSFPVHDRLTLTFPSIMASKRLLLLVKGKEKEQILNDLLYSSKTVDELPAKKLLEHSDLTIYYCEV